MFKLFVFVFAALLAVVAAKPGFVSTYAAPAVAYSGYAGYAAPSYAYSSGYGYASPYAYSAGHYGYGYAARPYSYYY